MCKRNPEGQCSKALTEKAKQSFESCVGQESCRILNLKQFVESSFKTKCANDFANFFVQYECHSKSEMLEQKRQDGALIAATSVFSALFFMVAVYFLKQMSAINKVQWDVETVTAFDYAVEMRT